jgi:hypothetical protein
MHRGGRKIVTNTRAEERINFHNKPIPQIIFNGEILKAFPLKLKMRHKCPLQSYST